MASASTPAPAHAAAPEHVTAPPQSKWRKFGVPTLIVVLAAAVVFTITRNWNAWEGGHVEQVTDDAYVRGDLTPLSTKVPGIVRDVKVSDYQQVHKGDLLVQLEDDDYLAQVAQATAAVEAAKAAIENNRAPARTARYKDRSGPRRNRAGKLSDHRSASRQRSRASRCGAHPGRTQATGGALSDTFNHTTKSRTGSRGRTALRSSIREP